MMQGLATGPVGRDYNHDEDRNKSGDWYRNLDRDRGGKVDAEMHTEDIK